MDAGMLLSEYKLAGRKVVALSHYSEFAKRSRVGQGRGKGQVGGAVGIGAAPGIISLPLKHVLLALPWQRLLLTQLWPQVQGSTSATVCALVGYSERASSSFLPILSDWKLKASSAWLTLRFLSSLF